MPYNKYYKQKIQVSLDEGVTWNDVTPAQYVRGSVYEVGSPDCTPPIYRWTDMDISKDWICEYVPPTPQYRWVNMDITTDYICDGTTKYYKQKKQVSNDEGQTWQDVTPAEYQRGSIYEAQSTDCGYVPPTPTEIKFQATYSGGKTYEKDCDGNATLTSGETKHSTYTYSAMTSAVIGNCVTEIGDSAFADCTGLTSVTIPDSVTSIGYDAFGGCINLENITIPSGITYIGVGAIGETKIKSVELVGGSDLFIGRGAFYGCSSLSSLTIHNGAGTISGSAFQNCTNLKNVYIGRGINGGAPSIDQYIFSGCTKIENIYLNMPEILYDLFPNVKNTINTLEFGEHVKRIANKTFEYKGNLDTLIVRATTPPRLGYDAFSSTKIRIIYVPAESVEAYKTAANWSKYASRIQPIP